MTHLPTIKDVAAVAGVHFTTVSMALRGDPRLRAETRQRIFAAAARIGYRSTPVSEALSRRRKLGRTAGRTPRMAFVTNRSPEHPGLQPASFRRTVKGAREQAEAAGYEFDLLFVGAGHHDSPSLYRHLLQSETKGIIMGAFEPSREGLELPWEEFAIVKIDSLHMAPACTFVSVDQMDYVQRTFRELRKRGYRRIGMAIGENEDRATDYLSTGALLVEQAAMPEGARVEPLYLPSEVRHYRFARLLAGWIKRESLDAVISSWTHIRSIVEASGHRCPSDTACACMCLSRASPDLAGVMANFELVGGRAAGLLAGLLQSEQYGVPALPTNTYVQGYWHDGSSAPLR